MQQLSNCRVLIVEDDFFLADDAAHDLSAAGAAIVGPIAKFDEARAQIEEEGFDVALIDIKLDDEMAYPLADMLMAQGTPLAFVTDYDHASIPSRFADVPYLAKPISAGALLDVFQQLCALESPTALNRV